MNKLKLFGAVFLLAYFSACTTVPVAPTPTAAAPKLAVGVTFDDVEDIVGIVNLLNKLPRKPWVRIVFDEGRPAKDYLAAVQAIRSQAYVLGELLDSSALKKCDQKCYEARARDYANTFGTKIDAIEIINEPNGDWTGPDTVVKTVAAADIMYSAGIPIWITPYADERDSWVPWFASLPAGTRAQVAYVGISMYPDDNNGFAPNLADFTASVEAAFPNVKGIGIGECGPGKSKLKSLSQVQRMAVAKTAWTYRGTSPKWWGALYWYGTEEIAANAKGLVDAMNAIMK